MRSELGADWESNFASFPRVPMAAASIGQVHRATLAGSNQEVAVKVQFPGIHNSIESDLNNLSLLLRGSAILPRGLYLNNTIAVFRGELADECDYTKEAESQRKMKQFLQADGDNFFEVPKVIDDLSTRQVLTTEIQSGRPLSEIRDLGQPLRDKVCSARHYEILRTAAHSHCLTDWHCHTEAVYVGALPVPLDANRSQLGKLPVRSQEGQGERDIFAEGLRPS